MYGLCVTLFVSVMILVLLCVVFFFNDTATTEIYTLSLHDALPISRAYPDLRVLGRIQIESFYKKTLQLAPLHSKDVQIGRAHV